MNSAIGFSEGAEVPEDKTDNELIAQFMGIPKNGIWYTVSFIHAVTADELKYDKLWEWLMPVVGRIANTGCMVQIQIDPGFKDVASCMIAKRTKMISFKGSNLLEVTYKTVVEFIKWYNLESLKNKPI